MGDVGFMVLGLIRNDYIGLRVGPPSLEVVPTWSLRLRL